MDNLIDQKAIDWLNNISYEEKEDTKNIEKPKFVKLLSNKTRKVIWYKKSESSSKDTEVLVEASPAEIKRWNLK